MSEIWVTIAALTVITFAFKAAGPLAVGGYELSPRAAGVIALAAPALLAGLVVYETLGAKGSDVEVDARLVGLAGAAGALALRMPILVVVGIAAALAAGTRALA
ncbi:MAG: AzlD domain-containing protein [Thermoleophilaceae bacterium]|nr:AzlD domain-containing protein [Thermoleophilaceae bacterium]